MKSVFKFIFALCFALAGTFTAFSAPENHEEFARQYMPESQAIFERFRKDCGETKLLRDSLAADLKVMNRALGDDAAYCALVSKVKELEMQENAWEKLLKDCYFKYNGGLFTDEQLSQKDIALVKEKLAWEEKELNPLLKNIVDFSKNPPENFVVITPVFLICKYEITQKEYKAVMGKNPSYFNTGDDNSSFREAMRFRGENQSNFKNDDSRPVECVSRNDAMEFCKKLTERESVAGRLPAGYKYTLPTSKQWEFACRAGTTTKYCSGDTEEDLSRVAWYGRNSNGKTHPVGTKEPNAWGIYDMHGNVWEWCLDKNPHSRRSYRGGSYYDNAGSCESADGYSGPISPRDRELGFRVVLVPVGE